MAVANLVCLGVLGSLVRSGVPGIRQAVGANILTIIAVLLFCVQLALGMTTLLVLVLANLCFSLGACAFYAGVSRFLGQESPWRWLAGLLAASTAANILFMYVWPLVNVRIVVASATHAAIYAGLSNSLWRALPHVRARYSYRFTLGASLFGLVGHSVRALVYASNIETLEWLGQPLPWNSIFLVLGVLVMPTLLLGFIMMIHERMLGDREREADTDFLTGLLTRKAWWREAERLRIRAAGNATDLTILVVDLDYFKQINDRYGHSGGDAVLRHFASLISGVVREDDVVGRMGGEEFALAFLGVSVEQACEIGERLQQVLKDAPCIYEGEAVACTFSGGLALWHPGESMEAVIRRADRALYAAKAAGRAQLMIAEAPAQG